MSFFQDVFTAIGAITLAYGAADMIRHYRPNYHRVLFPLLAVGMIDAYVPQFSILTWGFQIGTAVTVVFLLWYLRTQRVVRQDGSIDNG